MLFTNIKRIIRAGFLNFWRNSFVSLSAIMVLSVTLFVIGSLFFNNILLKASLDELRDKVDVNVYFLTTALESDILVLKEKMETFPEVDEIRYISREDALFAFKARHENDTVVLQALEEVGDNPLGASLTIKTKMPSQYENVQKFLESEPVLSSDGKPLIQKTNYFENKVAIDRLTEIIDSSEKSNLAKTVILVIISIVVAFNTIRLAIYISREEISVMRLVGASNKYVRGPFVIVGMIYGLIAALVTLALFYPITHKFGPLFYPLPLFFTDSFGDMTLFDYYVSNFGQIFMIIALSGVVLGAVSSWLAVRRYLKI